MDNQDPWSWTNSQRPVAPLSMQVQSSPDQAPGVINKPQDPLEQQIMGMGVSKGAEYAASNLPGLFSSATPAATSLTAAPVSTGLGMTAVPAAASAPLSASLGSGLASSGALTAAPAVMEGLGTGLLASAAPAAAGTTAALGAGTAAGALGAGTAATTAGALGAGAAGTAAATNFWNPIGWAAMGYLGGKALKLW